MSKHTTGDWFISDWNNEIIVSADGVRTAIADGPSRIVREANAKRIVDCVNALEGLSSDALDSGWNFKDMSKHCREIEQQRDELIETLEKIVESIKNLWIDEYPDEALDLAVQAIAKAKGEL